MEDGRLNLTFQMFTRSLLTKGHTKAEVISTLCEMARQALRDARAAYLVHSQDGRVLSIGMNNAGEYFSVFSELEGVCMPTSICRSGVGPYMMRAIWDIPIAESEQKMGRIALALFGCGLADATHDSQRLDNIRLEDSAIKFISKAPMVKDPWFSPRFNIIKPFLCDPARGFVLAENVKNATCSWMYNVVYHCCFADGTSSNRALMLVLGTTQLAPPTVDSGIACRGEGSGLYMHVILFEALYRAQGRLRDIIQSDQAHELTFSGVGVGGAVALVLAAHYAILTGKTPKVFTFGAPNIGNDKFTDYVHGLVDHTLVVSQRDPLGFHPNAESFAPLRGHKEITITMDGHVVDGKVSIDSDDMDPLVAFASRYVESGAKAYIKWLDNYGS